MFMRVVELVELVELRGGVVWPEGRGSGYSGV